MPDQTAKTKAGKYAYRILRANASGQRVGLSCIVRADFPDGDQMLVLVSRRFLPSVQVELDEFQRAMLQNSHQAVLIEIDHLWKQGMNGSAIMDRLTRAFKGTIEFDAREEGGDLTVPLDDDAIASEVIKRAISVFRSEVEGEKAATPPPIPRAPRKRMPSSFSIQTYAGACSP